MVFRHVALAQAKKQENSGDLNSNLVPYSDHGDLFAHRMVHYSEARYDGSSVFRSSFG